MTDINQVEAVEVSEEELYGTAPIGSLFGKVVVPSIIAMVIMGTQGIIDGLFLGNFIGPNAMASANIASPVLQIIMALAMVIGIGGTAFIGRCLGENDVDKARDIFKSCFIAEIILGVLIVVVGLFFSRELAASFGANEVLIDGTSDYIKVITFFSPLVMLYMLFSFTNRVIGKPELFLIASVVSIVSNIGLNYVFIVLLELEMQGAALATSLSYCIGFLINLPPMMSKETNLNIYVGKFDISLLKKACYNGSSEGITGVATGITVLVFNLTFMHFYGEVGVSAFTIVSYIAQMTSLIMFGMSDGITPILSYNFGAKNNDRIKKIMQIAIIGNFIIGLIAYLVILFFGETLVGFFADGDLDLIDLTYNGAKLYAISFILCGFNILISAFFTAKGDAIKSVCVSSSRGLIFILVGIFTLPWVFGVTGVWLVAPFADILTVFVSILVLKVSNKNQYDTKEVIEDISIINVDELENISKE